MKKIKEADIPDDFKICGYCGATIGQPSVASDLKTSVIFPHENKPK